MNDDGTTLLVAADSGIRGERWRRALVFGSDALVRLAIVVILVRAMATAEWSAEPCATGEVCSELFPRWMLLAPLLVYLVWNAGVVVAIGVRSVGARSGMASRNDVMLVALLALARLLWLVPLAWRKANDWPVLIVLLVATIVTIVLAVALGMRRPVDAGSSR